MKITRANADAIKYACLKFHYAKSVPQVQYGYNIFNDNGEWCGCVCYGGGATPNIGKPFGLNQGEILELVRVALNGKQMTTSQAVAQSLKKLHSDDPLCKMVVSYADIDQDHYGVIYQATNFIYLGGKNAGTRSAFIIHGKKTHPRNIGDIGGVQSLKWIRENIDPNATEFISKGKREYVFVFDKRLRKQIQKQMKEYPKKDELRLETMESKARINPQA